MLPAHKVEAAEADVFWNSVGLKLPKLSDCVSVYVWESVFSVYAYMCLCLLSGCVRSSLDVMMSVDCHRISLRCLFWRETLATKAYKCGYYSKLDGSGSSAFLLLVTRGSQASRPHGPLPWHTHWTQIFGFNIWVRKKNRESSRNARLPPPSGAKRREERLLK